MNAIEALQAAKDAPGKVGARPCSASGIIYTWFDGTIWFRETLKYRTINTQFTVNRILAEWETVEIEP